MNTRQDNQVSLLQTKDVREIGGQAGRSSFAR
jgi:hypothetical protein